MPTPEQYRDNFQATPTDNQYDVAVYKTHETADRTLYSLATEHGGLDAYYHKRDNIYDIERVGVRGEWRQGNGRRLVEAAVAHARSLRAARMQSMIITREGYELMRSIFGDESIAVEKLGDFAADESATIPEEPTTEARLDYPLD